MPSGWSFWISAAFGGFLCQAGVVLQGQGGLKSGWWLNPQFSLCHSDVPLLCLAGYYAVELVNDSLYDWNVKLLK